MRLRVQLAIIALLIGVAALVYFGLVQTRPEATTKPLVEREWIVDTVKATVGVTQPILRLTGRIVAVRDAELRPLAEGRIVEIGPSFYAGGRVDAGELLVRIDPFEYEAAAADARAGLLEARAGLMEAQAELAASAELVGFDREQEDLRKRDLERKQRLSGQGAVAEKTMDDARIAYLTARETGIARVQTIERLKAQLQRLEASVTRAEVRLSRAERDLQETRLSAPFDGVLVDVSATIGKRVGANDRIARIVDSAHLEARFHMSDAQYGRLALGGLNGRPAEVVWRAGETAIRLRASLARVEGEFDAASGGVWVYAAIQPDDNSRVLRPGAFVEVETADIAYRGVVRLPEAAIYGANRAYVLEDGHLRERIVAIQGRAGGEVIVSGDLADGDAVVTTRIPEIGPGLKARTRDGST